MEITNNNDDRPFVKDLLEQHSSDLDELRAILEKEESYSDVHYDDIWMLRYLLSHKKVSQASSAAIKTMNFRKEYKLNEMGDIRHKLVDHMNHQSDRHFDVVKQNLAFSCKSNTAVMYAQPDQDRGLIQIICPGQFDMGGQAKKMSDDEVFEAYVKTNEVIYQILDEVTRRTGKVTKLLKIVDASDFTLGSLDRAFVKRDAAINKELEDYYPQMLGTVVVSDMGSWFTTIWRVLKPLFPKRFIEKFAFVQPLKNSKDIKYFLQYMSKQHLWERYGGNSSDWPVTQPFHLWRK